MASEPAGKPVWQQIASELMGEDDHALAVADRFLLIAGVDAGDLRQQYLIQVWRNPTANLSSDLAFAVGEILSFPTCQSEPLTTLDAATWVFIVCLFGRCDRESGYPEWGVHAHQLCRSATALRYVLDSSQLETVLREALRRRSA